jgi:hypothetical protein
MLGTLIINVRYISRKAKHIGTIDQLFFFSLLVSLTLEYKVHYTHAGVCMYELMFILLAATRHTCAIQFKSIQKLINKYNTRALTVYINNSQFFGQ